MKKFVTLFTDSYRELKSVRTITTAAMFAAIAIILGMFSINAGNYIRISFSSIPNGMVAYLFGPVVGSLFSGSLDVLKYLLKPAGAFFPGLTLVTMLAGLMYGCMYYRKPVTLRRILVAKFLVMLICNVVLNTLCLSILYGKGFMVLLPARALKNLVMWPVDSMIFYIMAKAMDSMGVFQAIRSAKTAGTR
ncbi:folate family ECF transporter S component [Clostridium sp. Marseille-P2415]|uniref:folate family ECF transporter S component n=1 Tax=Clostridium sp. Marseille-P2415 TaxID=1805471 RepID=UPI0009884DB2|nr:folate family ECF transporter S component [Clostridium sp. Marseille-P2415]